MTLQATWAAAAARRAGPPYEQRVRRPLAISAALLLLVALAVGAAVVRLRLQDPLAALPRDPPSSLTVHEDWREQWHGRTLLHVALRGAAVGEMRFVVSLPDPVPPQRMPVVVVLGGLHGGSLSIRRISEVVGDPGPNAFVGYDWPLPREDPSVAEVALRIAELRREVLSVPGQVDAILAWASRQSWADPERVSLLGFSLGAFVAPAAQRLAARRGAAVRWTIIAYGGAPIGAVIAAHPAVRPRWLARLLGAVVDLLLRPLEPSEHLPSLRGSFLVLRAAHDRLIAPAAAIRLGDLTPQPRTIVVIEGDHVGLGPSRAQLLEKVVSISRAWLIEQGAIAPAQAAEAGAPAQPRRHIEGRRGRASTGSARTGTDVRR